MDILSERERSARMSRIRSKWTVPEKLLHNYLKGYRISHRMHPDIDGSPDLVIPDKKLAIFIHGCFWHGCPTHYKQPSNNAQFWKKKVQRNKRRDKKNALALKTAGWKVCVIWEHEIPRKKPYDDMERIIRQVSR